MSAVKTVAEAQEAASDAILSVSRMGAAWGTSAWLVVRAAALQHQDIKGGLVTAEKLRALADELGGGS